MDDNVIRLLFLGIMMIGIVGAILPVLPGAPLTFGSLILAKIFHFSEIHWGIIILFGILTFLGIIMDYFIPILTTKKMGGSKYGIWGMIIGLIIGIIFSPFGFVSLIISPFLGAFLGELLYDYKNQKRAFKAALGSLLGYALTSSYGLILSLTMTIVFLITDIFS